MYSNTLPDTDRLAKVPNGKFETVLKNMPETKRPCIIVCAIFRDWLVSCSKKFACFNSKYTIPAGSMRLTIPNIAPLMLRVRRDFDRLLVSWEFPYSVPITSYQIDLNYGSSQSFESINELLHTTDIVQRSETSMNIRLDGYKTEAEKYVFVSVCSIRLINHRENRNCSITLVLPLSEVEEDLEENMAIEITGIRAHMYSASIILSEPLENRNTFELHVMCLADHETVRAVGTSPRVLEWRTANMLGNILNLESLNPTTTYRCAIHAKPMENSIAYTIFADKEFSFRTNSIQIDNPPTPVISGSQYELQGNKVVQPFSINLQHTSPQAEVSSYLLVAWPQNTNLPTQFDNNRVSTMSEDVSIGKSIPFIQEILPSEMLPIEYIFDFTVNKKAYKQDECYYFIIAAVPFETSTTFPFSTSNKCIKFIYSEGITSSLSSGIMKRVVLTSVILIVFGLILTILVIMVLVTWKMRPWISDSKEGNIEKDEKKDGLDRKLTLWEKVTGKGQYREDVRETLIKKPKVEFMIDSESLPNNPPLISWESIEFSSD
ncbi:hypothetical protein LOD99_2935 [Oopsacas minuta]|uniref:Fibronectin type-III domain-containing protein n=1 Tax=Oopsacas minuta TaxID=111878 RepID=A0AAV7JYR3_9METZ|nr:hypothetical protein LOD99_2935 [Oopsacas minuta]